MSSSSAKLPPPPLPRRRRAQRYAHSAPLRAKCSTWSSFRELFTLNLSQTGLFIPTDASADLGEMVEIVMYAPDRHAIRLEGTVRHVLQPTTHHPAGIGVELAEVVEADRERYAALVERAAAEGRVQPASTPASGSHGGALFGDSTDSGAGAAATAFGPGSSSGSRALFPEADDPLPERARDRAPSEATSTAGSNPSAAARAPREAAPLVAIDFGTSRSSISLLIKREVRVLKIDDRGWDIPSVIGFLPDGSVCVGDDARDLLASAPDRAIRSPKRLLGRRYEDPETAAHLSTLAVSHSAGPHGEVMLHPAGLTYTAPQICAPIIYRLREAAEQALGQQLTHAVFTTPVSFDEPRFRALDQAAQLAGLKVAAFVDEPTAAALCHRFDSDFDGLVAVYDFGGGTFDFSVVDVSSADFKVVATAGDTWLGGDDFDDALANAAANDFWHAHGIELRKQIVPWQRLRLAAEQTKRELSAHPEAVVRLPEAALRSGGPIDLEYRVTREDLASICAEIIQRSLDTCSEALQLGGVRPADLNAIYLSGGTSYIPAVREALTKAFGKPPKAAVPPERAVATGAAIFAALLRDSSARST